MITYSSESENHLIRLLIDYTYLKSREGDLVGIFMLPYFDDKNIFEIIQFFNYEPSSVLDGSIDIGTDEIRFICLNKNRIREFEELSSCEILYDPKNKLCDIKRDLISANKIYRGSNQLIFHDDFKNKLHKYISKKLEENENLENDLIYYTLVDFYYCILYNDFKIDDLNFEVCINNIKNRNNLHFFTDNPGLHKECLEESIRYNNIDEKQKIQRL